MLHVHTFLAKNKLIQRFFTITIMASAQQKQLEFPIMTFSTAPDFDAFLAKEYATAPGIYLKLAKKNSGITSISAAEAIEVALCHGWIDGRANSVDEQYWTVRYTPRRAKSIWSKKNVDTVARLISDGRMQPAGQAAVDAAKADGRWERAYSGGANIAVPEDFTVALSKEPAAEAFWAGLSKTQRFATLHRLETASEKVRERKIEGFVALLKVGKQPGAEAQEKYKNKSGAKRKVKVERDGVEKVKKESSRASSVNSVNVDEQAQPRRAGLRQRKAVGP